MEWIPIVLVFMVLGFYALSRLFGRGHDKATQEEIAKDRAQSIKEAAEAQLKEQLRAVARDKADLEEIKAIEDDEERLKALAAFGNRRR